MKDTIGKMSNLAVLELLNYAKISKRIKSGSEQYVLSITELPDMKRENYLWLREQLTTLGATYEKGSKFVFSYNPENALEHYKDFIQSHPDCNFKQDFQYFPTPEALCLELLSFARLCEDLHGRRITFERGQQPYKILEPSAGRGNIVKAIEKRYYRNDLQVDCCELSEFNQLYLKELPNVSIVGDDFLETEFPHKYDRIIANPPFSKGQDVIHVTKMIELLNPQGVLRTIMSPSVTDSNMKAGKNFRNMLTELELRGDIDFWFDKVESGAFIESGTSIATTILTVIKY